MRTKPWYKIEYTEYIHWPEIHGKINMPAHTTWYISERYFEGIRKATKFLEEHKDGKLSIIYR